MSSNYTFGIFQLLSVVRIAQYLVGNIKKDKGTNNGLQITT
jgi:cellobiose-specific phosphotransferase system component IIC